MRIYLDVAYEDKDKVKALDAHWDYIQKRWYIFEGQWSDVFEPWVGKYQVPIKQAPRAEILMK